VFVGLEAGVRAVRRIPPGPSAALLERLLTLAVVVTSAGGLGLLVGGARPRELLHFVYAVVAIGAVPVAGSLSRRASPRRRGFATLAGALIAFVVILRLFGTG
jgi:hypothetical protein